MRYAMRNHYKFSVPPITEPYHPLVPCRRERQRVRLEIIALAIGGILFLGWLGGYIKGAYDRGHVPFVEVAENIRRAVAGEL